MIPETSLPVILSQFRSPILTSFFTSVTALGSLTLAIAILTALTLRHRERGLKYLMAFLLAAGTTQAMKQLLKTPRPEAAIVETLTYGFPSGHATAAFSLAMILSREEEGLSYYFYALAVLVAFSRLYLGVHFFVEVLAGAAVGYGVTRAYLERQSLVNRLRKV